MPLTDAEVIKLIPKKAFLEYEEAKKSKKVNFYDYNAMRQYAKQNNLLRLYKLDWSDYMDMVAGYKVLMYHYGLELWFDNRCDEKPKKSRKVVENV